MAITSTQTQSAVRNHVIGRYLDTGTVAAFTITLGFKPRHIKVANVTSGDMVEWFEGMADASGIKSVAAGTRSLITSNGITPTADGFTVGLDTDICYTSEQLSWVAEG
jgi:hypothetical protein